MRGGLFVHDQIVLIYLDNDPYNIRGANQPSTIFFSFHFLFSFFTYYFHFLLCFVLLVFSFSPGLFFVYTHKQTEGGVGSLFLSLCVYIYTHMQTHG